MKTSTRPSADSLYAEIQDVDVTLGTRDGSPDSAEYWREAVVLKTRQRDLWRQIAKAADSSTPAWARRAAFQSADHCSDQADRYAQFARQCVAPAATG